MSSRFSFFQLLPDIRHQVPNEGHCFSFFQLLQDLQPLLVDPEGGFSFFQLLQLPEEALMDAIKVLVSFSCYGTDEIRC